MLLLTNYTLEFLRQLYRDAYAAIRIVTRRESHAFSDHGRIKSGYPKSHRSGDEKKLPLLNLSQQR